MAAQRIGELKLRSGRLIDLRRIEQWQLYADLWEGLPTKEMNRGIIERIISRYRGDPYPGDPFLIVPEETAIEYRQGEVYPFGTPAALPGIACAGYFVSSFARDVTKDYSVLCVIWFQSEYAFPIEPQVLEQIAVIDWERHGIDREY